MLRRHELSSSHKEAVEEVTITLPASTGNIAEILSREVGERAESKYAIEDHIFYSIFS